MAHSWHGLTGSRGVFQWNTPAVLLCLCTFGIPSTSLFAINTGGDYQLDSYSAGGSGGALSSGGEYSSRGAIAQTAMPPNEGLRRGGEYTDRAGFYNPPHFTYQKGLAATLSFPAGNAYLTLPSGSVEKESYDIVLNKDAASAPLTAEIGEIERANSRITLNEGPWALPLTGAITETYIFDEQSSWGAPFNKPGTLSLAYRDDNDDGIVDGSNPPVKVDTTHVWTLDRNRDMWAKLPSTGVDRSARMITVPFMIPGVFAVLGTMDESVKDAYAFPVPFRPNGQHAGIGAGMSGTAASGITFANLPQRGRIEIYTLDGLLVRKLTIPENSMTAQMQWDVKNSAGEKVRSDVYIWRIISGSNVKTGKLMIIW